jgi:hypothetical protein
MKKIDKSSLAVAGLMVNGILDKVEWQIRCRELEKFVTPVSI